MQCGEQDDEREQQERDRRADPERRVLEARRARPPRAP
jgi:hypothetical protein